MSEITNNLKYEDSKFSIENAILDKVEGTIDSSTGEKTITLDSNLKVLGSLDISGATYSLCQSPEWIKVLVDSQERIIAGVRTDGSVYIGQLEGLDDKLQEMLTQMQAMLDEAEAEIDAKLAVFNSVFSIVENPEWIQVTTDSEGKILEGITAEGKKKVMVETLVDDSLSAKKVDIDGATIENIQDPEGRTEIKTDAEGKILSYRDSEGVMHENVGIETNHLRFSEDGMTEFQQALLDSGFNPQSPIDWSNAESLEIPMPRCSVINITNNTNDAIWPTSKEGRWNYNPGVNADLHYYIEFWDMHGNYFKKPIIISAQGNSSLGMPKKNGGFDMFADTWDGKTFSFKIGDWIPQDSFHLKAYYADYFVGVCPIGYKLFNQIISTRDIFTNRDWKKVFIPSKATIGTGCTAMNGEDDKYALDNDARCFPDGFPCIVHLNGNFYGVYSWQLKKHRDNYMMSKKKPTHIHLDGCISEDSIFLSNGNINWDIFNGITPDTQGNSEGVEIRNPKPKSVAKDGWVLTCVDGSKYSDLNMKELIGSDNTGYDQSNTSHVKSNQTKQAIITLSTYIPELKSMEENSATTAQIREKIEEYFDVQSFIDYLIFGDVTTNYDGFRKNWQWITYDGFKWFIEPYDLDGIFGWTGWREYPPTGERFGNNKDYPSGWIIQYYQTELEARYAELRDAGIFNNENIIRIFKDWINAIGTDNYQKNHDKWPNDKEHYPDGPEETHYDNIYRVSNWLDARFIKCDEIYNYNQD